MRFSIKFFSTNTKFPLGVDSPITRIRIWKSGYFKKDGDFQHTNIGYALLKGIGPFRTANIGHVALETKHFYASLWPERLTIFNKLKMQDGEYSNIVIDEQSEARPPDHLVDLKTLNVNAMWRKLEDFKEHNNYHLMGSNWVFNTNTAASCSSLAYDLLIAGGIRKLVPMTVSIRDYIVVTPNNLTEMVLSAKEAEKSAMFDEEEVKSPKI